MALKRAGKKHYNLPDNSLFGVPEGDFHGVFDADHDANSPGPALASRLPHNKKANPAKGTADANHRGERRGQPVGSDPEEREPAVPQGRAATATSRSVLLAGLHRGVGAGARAIDPRSGRLLWPPPPAVLVEIPGAPAVGRAGNRVPRRWLYVDSCFRAIEVSDHGVPSLLAPSLYAPLGTRVRQGRAVVDTVDVQAWRLVPNGTGAGVEYATVVTEADRAYAAAVATGDEALASLISQRFFAIAAWWGEVVMPDLAGYSLALGVAAKAA